jgi:hypothetical protein
MFERLNRGALHGRALGVLQLRVVVATAIGREVEQIPEGPGRVDVAGILGTAKMGIERIAAGIPHIQNQKTSEMMTRTGLRVNRLASSIGVTLSPSIK